MIKDGNYTLGNYVIREEKFGGYFIIGDIFRVFHTALYGIKTYEQCYEIRF